ncbi:MAG: GNAT family N-acetyltransferase, partial [Gammaproteobacteria bacterium]|nr:GNAT family N-acetyltransferase [Gammaproteobacteria bacterium]
MRDYTIELLDDLPENIEEKMHKGLVAYETGNGVDCNYKKFSFTLVTKSGEAFGVLNAYTVFAEVYIDDLWVDVSWRGRGY